MKNVGIYIVVFALAGLVEAKNLPEFPLMTHVAGCSTVHVPASFSIVRGGPRLSPAHDEYFTRIQVGDSIYVSNSQRSDVCASSELPGRIDRTRFDGRKLRLLVDGKVRSLTVVRVESASTGQGK
jgi:hypothetical protein